MLRAVLAVIAGYLGIALFAFAFFVTLYNLLGADVAYEPGSFEISGLWLGLSMAGNLVGGVVGGAVAMWVGRKRSAAIALAAAVLLIGLLGALSVVEQNRSAEPPPPREAEVTLEDAMRHSRQPAWVAFTNPFIGVAGVLLGGALVRRREGS